MERKIFETKTSDQGKKKPDFKDFAPDPKLMERLTAISQIVGGDFGMSVKVGQPGQGSYFDLDNVEIKFDPLHFEPGKDWQMEFIAGHEGGHRAIDRSPRQIGGEIVEKMWQENGWPFLSNVIADCAMNSWVAKQYSRYSDLNRQTYDEMFEKENVIVGSPETHRMRARLGYDPKFTQFGSEIMRKWHKGAYSQNLPIDVVEALRNVANAVDESIQAVPRNTRESEVLTKAQERYVITRTRIWSEMKKLMDDDLNKEQLRQMIKDNLKEMTDQQAKKDKEQKSDELGKQIEKKEKEIEDLKKQLEKAKTQEEKDKLNQEISNKKKEKRELEKQKQDNDNKPTLDPELAKQLAEQIKEAVKNAKESLEKENIELSQKAKELSEEAKGASDPLTKAQLEEMIKKLIEQFKANKDLQKQIEGGQAMPMPMDQLPQELQEALREAFDKLPDQAQGKARQAAKKELEDIEDSLNKEIDPKIGPDKPASHQDRRSEREEKEGKKKEARDSKKTERLIEQSIESQLTQYQKTYLEVRKITDDVYSYLAKFFIPKRHPRYAGGYDSGQRARIQKAMEYESKVSMGDRTANVDFWERLNLPEKFDYKFTIVVDLSGSMEQSNKLPETFKALIVFTEVLNRLGIDFSIKGFSNNTFDLKSFSEKMNDAKRNKIAAEMKSRDNTYIGAALEEASDEILEQKGKNNFVIVLTDGDPSDGEKLTQSVREARAKNIKLIALGLGQGTDKVADYFPIGLPNLEVEQIKTIVAKLLSVLVMFPDIDEKKLAEDLELLRQGKKGKIIQAARPDQQAVEELNKLVNE